MKNAPAVSIPPLPAVGRKDTVALFVILSGVEGSKPPNTKNVPAISIPPLPAVGVKDKGDILVLFMGQTLYN